MSESEGYRALAQFFNDESGIAILNRFGTLNIQNLLYMQAEIFHLEKELQIIAAEDSSSSCAERQDYRYSMLNLQNSLNGTENFQWKKILEIRKKLKKYNEAVLRYHQMRTLPNPQQFESSNVRHILNLTNHTKYLLKDTDIEAWGSQNQKDLIALYNNDLKLDPFANWIHGSFLVLLHRLVTFKWIKVNPTTELASYNDSTVRLFTNAFRSLLVTVYPAIVMMALYASRNSALKLPLILVFAGIFTSLISLFTNAKTVELFMLSATGAGGVSGLNTVIK